ncbi:LapA family protein [Coprobacter tertius]|uniref:LapA family protein n=1 Tax=Coprobacter tertius TaxID=2944915 RepID=A0ABT1MLQ7_9BACT|nr:LapA family protein [Coprobacter tertius]MCP9612653.1 LapA family protein [Coprobacter tertius]
MLNLLMSTLEMMGLTFIIGFFVAAVIKGIASWADSLDFYNTHQEELLRLKRVRKLHQKVARLLEHEAIKNYRYGDKRVEFSRGINKDLSEVRPAGYYHGVSHGQSKLDLIDYYYSEDTQLMYLRKREQMIRLQEKRDNENNSSENKK